MRSRAIPADRTFRGKYPSSLRLNVLLDRADNPRGASQVGRLIEHAFGTAGAGLAQGLLRRRPIRAFRVVGECRADGRSKTRFHRSVALKNPIRSTVLLTLCVAALAAATGCAEQRTSSYTSTAEWREANRRAGLVPPANGASNRQPPMSNDASLTATSMQGTTLPVMSSASLLQMQPAPSAAFNAAAPPVRTVSRSARAMNMYGELESTTGALAGSPLDGSTNLVQVSFASEGACVDPAVDPTGTMIAFASTMHRRTSDIYIKAVNGRTMTQITSDPADDVMPAFSPDGRMIAFASNRSGNWDIYITSIDGGPATQITNEPDAEMHPTWSPDGRYIAYCRFGAQSARWEIWMTEVANPAGGGVKRFLDYGVFPEWSPDVARSKIAFQRAKQRGSRDYGIWTIDVVNGQASQPTEIVSAANAALINPCWSPDGTRIAFVAVVEPQSGIATQQTNVWVVNVDGTGRTNLTSGQFANFQPAWAADGSVFFVSDRSGTDNVWAVQSGRSEINKPQPRNVANADNGAGQQ